MRFLLLHGLLLLASPVATHSVLDGSESDVESPKVISNIEIEGDNRPWHNSEPLNGVKFQYAKALSPPSLDVSATQISRLRRVRGHESRRASVTALSRLQNSRNPPFNASISPVKVAGGFSTQYGVECLWDGKPLWLLFDTGSSDTWTPMKDFDCVDLANKPGDPAVCGFGHLPIEKFRHGYVDEVHIKIEYGSSETASGPMGYSDVSCGGIEVLKQQVGLMNRTYWHGNNVTSGILGLAFPSITSGFYGQVGQEAIWNAAPYTPWFSKAVMQGLVAPMFSVVLERNSTDGILAWGGLPPTTDWQPGSGVTTDLIIANIGGVTGSWEYSFYTIVPDGMRWGQMSDDTKYPFIVDTGSTGIFLPPPLAETIATSFNPPATYLYQWGAYYAPCDSVPPLFGIVISGKTFYIKPNDLIFQDVVDPATGFCAVALTTGGMGPYILGDVFLQSVVAVFDVGGAEMRFYSRYFSDENGVRL